MEFEKYMRDNNLFFEDLNMGSYELSYVLDEVAEE